MIREHWNSSSHFMAHRYGKLGPLYRGLGRLMEAGVWAYARLAVPRSGVLGEPRNILILRNNDFGDVLVTTPLFAAMRRWFPKAKISVAVGAWSVPVLKNNPNIDEILPVAAPWYNHFIARRSIIAAMRYAIFHPEVRMLREKKFDLMIDVVGSHFGAMLAIAARVPDRVGVKGYAGGHTGMTRNVIFAPGRSVAASNLLSAELLGATQLPPAKPQLFLDSEEIAAGKQAWPPRSSTERIRVVIAPGIGSAGRGWPVDQFAELARRLGERGDLQIMLLGGKQDVAMGEQIRAACPSAINRCGQYSLRQTFAAVAEADLVVCNNSMISHVAAAFDKQTLVLLGPRYVSTQVERGAWGYDGLSDFLGREGVQTEIATVEQAHVATQSKLDQIRRAA